MAVSQAWGVCIGRCGLRTERRGSSVDVIGGRGGFRRRAADGSIGMSDVGSVSGAAGGLVGVEVATEVLKRANDQQQVAASLLADAVEMVQAIQEAGKGEHVDATA